MKNHTHIRIVFLAITLILAVGVPTPVMAQGIVYGDTIPSGTIVDQDIILIGQNILVDGTVNGNVFALGNQVQINGDINGSLVLIGQNISISGMVNGGTYVAALTLELVPGSVLGRDLYVLSVGLTSGADTTINRDLFAIGLDAGLNGNVGRNLHTAFGPLQLYNGLMRLLGFEELTVELHFELPPPAPEPEAGPSSQRLLPIMRARRYPVQENENAFDWAVWATNRVREWVTLSLFGLLAVWLASHKIEQTKQPLLRHPWKTTGIGLLVLVVSINLFVLAILLAILIFSIGLALNYIQLWQLSIALWIVSYSLLTLALTILWLFIVYGTKIIFIYVLFTWLLNKLNPANWMKFLAILVGALVYVLLRSVPMIGWGFGLLASAAGIGTAWLGYQETRKAALAPEAIPPTRKSRKAKVV